MKEALDNKNEDYKVLIFEIEIDSEQEEQEANNENDPDEIKYAMSIENLEAIPMMRDEFIETLVKDVFDDQEHELALKIALGCQQVARSVCFVHFWAFNSLWLKFNTDKGADKKPNMKQLLEQAELEKQANQEKIEQAKKDM